MFARPSRPGYKSRDWRRRRPERAKGKRKASAGPPKPRKPRAKKQPPRICAHWCIFDNSMKQIALFDYNQRGLADERLATIRATKKSAHWIQIVKLPMVVAEIATDTAIEVPLQPPN